MSRWRKNLGCRQSKLGSSPLPGFSGLVEAAEYFTSSFLWRQTIACVKLPPFSFCWLWLGSVLSQWFESHHLQKSVFCLVNSLSMGCHWDERKHLQRLLIPCLLWTGSLFLVSASLPNGALWAPSSSMWNRIFFVHPAHIFSPHTSKWK